MPSKLNPADIGTRGLSPKELADDGKLWFYGPDFLKTTEDLWPNLQIGDRFEEYLSAATNVSVTRQAENLHYEDENVMNIIEIDKYNCLSRLYTVTSYVIKYKDKLLESLQ